MSLNNKCQTICVFKVLGYFYTSVACWITQKLDHTINCQNVNFGSVNHGNWVTVILTIFPVVMLLILPECRQNYSIFNYKKQKEKFGINIIIELFFKSFLQLMNLYGTGLKKTGIYVKYSGVFFPVDEGFFLLFSVQISSHILHKKSYWTVSFETAWNIRLTATKTSRQNNSPRCKS